MSDKKKEDQLLSSNYDGIQEYDNDLPRWWVQLFYLTIGFGLIYAAYIHLSGTPSDLETLAAEMKSIKAQEALRSATKGTSNLTLADNLKDPKMITHGKEIFVGKCAACHGQSGEGLVGPNLTDEFWINGGSPEEVHKTIVEGVPAKGMLAWKGLLSPEEINAVTSYIFSIKNTNLPGKAPEGNKG